jgi:hypothetical protein
LVQPSPQKKDYTGQIIASALVSAGFGIGAVVFHTQGSKAYHDYTNSQTMETALNNWDRVRRLDIYRNICIAGSLIFFGRLMYCHFKHDRSQSSTELSPVIDFQYASNPTIIIGLKRRL